jgi:splicing factor U2AF subunit
VKPTGFETFTPEQAKLTGKTFTSFSFFCFLAFLTQLSISLYIGMFNLPGHNRPYLPAGFDPSSVQTADGQNPPMFFRPPVFGAVGPGAPIGSLARQSRRLYVGNITMEATEETIANFFNQKMSEMNLVSDGHLGEDLQGLGLKGDLPVISVHVNYEKNYAFVEVSFFPLSPLFVLFCFTDDPLRRSLQR